MYESEDRLRMPARANRRGFMTLLLACLTWAAAPASGASAPSRVVLFVAEEAAPKMYLQAGMPVGYMTELAAEALRRAEFRVDVRPVPWARAVASAQAGLGVITSLSRTPERDKLFLYSDPIYVDRVLMITRKDSDLQLNGLADLAGLRVGMQQGASFGPAFEAALPTFSAERDTLADHRLRKLAVGRLDVAILSGGLPALRFYAARAGVDLGDLKVQKNPLVADTNHIAVARTYPDAPEIIRRVNIALSAMRSDGTVARILSRYE